jgi:hypothetical protein
MRKYRLKYCKDEVAGASRVVTFCALPEGFDQLAPVEKWNEVPPISEDYNKSGLLSFTSIVYNLFHALNILLIRDFIKSK